MPTTTNFIATTVYKSITIVTTRLQYHKSSNYSAKKNNSNLHVALILEPKKLHKIASGA